MLYYYSVVKGEGGWGFLPQPKGQAAPGGLAPDSRHLVSLSLSVPKFRGCRMNFSSIKMFTTWKDLFCASNFNPDTRPLRSSRTCACSSPSPNYYIVFGIPEWYFRPYYWGCLLCTSQSNEEREREKESIWKRERGKLEIFRLLSCGKVMQSSQCKTQSQVGTGGKRRGH